MWSRAEKNRKTTNGTVFPARYILTPEQFSQEALAGLSDFSHIVVIYYFHKVDPDRIEKTARHPRNNRDWPKVGIFAQRGKNRPNRIGVTVCRLERMEGEVIYVKGLDAIMDTPVLDIKPWFTEYGPRGRSSATFMGDRDNEKLLVTHPDLLQLCDSWTSSQSSTHGEAVGFAG